MSNRYEYDGSGASWAVSDIHKSDASYEYVVARCDCEEDAERVAAALNLLATGEGWLR